MTTEAIDHLSPRDFQRLARFIHEYSGIKMPPTKKSMVEGRLRKFYEEVVLLAQAFVHDPDTTVAKAVAATEKEVGAPIKITGFYRFALGEGVDRTSDESA